MDNDNTLGGVTAKAVYSNRLCGMCEFTDGLCYTSNPPKRKCTITGQYRFYDDPCNVPIDQLTSHGNNTNKPKVNDFSSKPLSTSDIIKESITVKGFNSLLNVIKLLVEDGYSFTFKGTDKNKYNENTHLTIEYYKENTSNIVYRNINCNNTLTVPDSGKIEPVIGTKLTNNNSITDLFYNNISVEGSCNSDKAILK